MILRPVRGVLVACGVSAVLVCSPRESKAICHWFSPCGAGACAQSTYAPPYSCSYPFGGFFANLFGCGPDRCAVPACSSCAPVCAPAPACGVPQACYRPVCTTVPAMAYMPVAPVRPVTTWMRQVSYLPYNGYRVAYPNFCSPCAVPCSPCIGGCSPCSTYAGPCASGACGVTMGAPAAGCGCGDTVAPVPTSVMPTPATAGSVDAPRTFAPTAPAAPGSGTPTPVPTLPPSSAPSDAAPSAAPSATPSAAPTPQTMGAGALVPVTPQTIGGPANSPAALPRYAAPQPIPSANNAPPIPLPRLPTMEKTTSLVAPTNLLLISSRPATPSAPAIASPVILGNDGWHPVRN